MKKIGTDKIRKIVKEHFYDEDFLLPEGKIDSIIKEYLQERTEFVENEEKKSFSPKSVDAIEEIITNLSEIVDDLEVIKEKESDVILQKNKYTDEIFENYLNDVNKLIKGLSNIVEITKNKKSNKDLGEI